jgi:hypothetical protein
VLLSLPIIPVVLFFIAISFIVMANMIFYAILGEVNGKRAPQEQTGMLFVNVSFFEVLRLHKGLFPASQKRAVMNILGGSRFCNKLYRFFSYGEERERDRACLYFSRGIGFFSGAFVGPKVWRAIAK